MPIRILIADDHALMREGLKQLFALVGDVVVVGEAYDDTSLRACLATTEVDLLLLDMTMPGIHGSDLISRLRGPYPSLPILVLSMHNQPFLAQQALKAGANGYISKDNDPEAVLTALRRVAAGGHFIDAAIAEKMALESCGLKAPTDHDRLSSREIQTLRLLSRGASLNDIAAELRISSKTVSTHKTRLMEKMGFKTNADLMRYAITHGLTD